MEGGAKKKRRRSSQGPAAAPPATAPTYTVGSDQPPPPTAVQLRGLAPAEQRQAGRLLRESGLVHFTDALLPQDFLAQLRTAAARSSDRIQTELRARGVRYRLDAAAHTGRARALEHDRSFRYAEVASRCLGRLDIRHGLQSPPFTDPLLTHNPTWFPVVQAALGAEARLVYAGLVLNLPGSAAQPYHTDGGHLFGKSTECPAHCLDVFVPLIDVPTELGPT